MSSSFAHGPPSPPKIGGSNPLVLPSDHTISNLLKSLPTYSPITPLTVSTHLLRSNGLTYTDPKVPILTSLIIDKFVAELIVKAKVEKDRRMTKNKNKKRKLNNNPNEKEEDEKLVLSDFFEPVREICGVDVSGLPTPEEN
ncbi:hypothetical protein TrLO_g1574 [Triparma laevis f. longispina]|uniref:Uncharacterized protein n=1 Tax=Triparma laevis f. longispina TaxID=1714387 RepID=A0A9W7A0T5_9STRA|nr:hypothetical protein TrLO_g1574 [Triparma laevis f. longispina]